MSSAYGGYILGREVITTTKTAAYSASRFEHVLVDSNAAAGDFEVTMPASPAVGDWCRVTMINDHATRVVTLNGDTTDAIESDANNSPEKYTLCLEGDSVLLEWVGGDCGWSVIDDAIQPHSARLEGDADITTNSANVDKRNTELGTTVFNVGGLIGADRLTVRRSGIYIFHGSVRPYNAPTAGKYYWARLYKNGAVIFENRVMPGGANENFQCLVSGTDKSSSGDYYDLYFRATEADIGVRGVGTITWFEITEIR